jgi:hypothetical protein
MALNRLGRALGTQHILSIPGRKTGKLRSTPVSLLTIAGRRYACTGVDTDWVKNARAAGWGILSRGPRAERVRLVEVPVEERAPILREFPHQVPHGVAFFERILGLPNDPEAFAAAAHRCPVFRFDPMLEEDYQEHAPTTSGSRQAIRRTDGGDVTPSISRTLLAGLAGGAAFWVATFLTFALVGSGLDQRSGPLVDPAVQSPKLLAVLSELEPRPLFATAPHLVLLAYAVFGTGYALLLRSVAAGWPAGVWSRAWRLGAVIWGLSCAFFELLGPVNLLGEPLGLAALELGFWAVAALAEAVVVVFLVRHPRREERAAPAALTRDSRPGGQAAEVAGEARAGGPTGPVTQTRCC